MTLVSICFVLHDRCGYQFCYTCGAEWGDKKPTCSCPLWDEENILLNDTLSDAEDEDDDDDDGDDDDDDYSGSDFDSDWY